ncbi:MAG: hypothetical protein ACKV2T_02850 [Kofleriaceae bacterium]
MIDKVGGIPVVVAGVPARRSSRLDTIGKATNVPVEELFIIDTTHGWAYQLLTGSMPSTHADVFFATFRIDTQVVKSPAPRDDREALTRSAGEVLARHASNATRCQIDLVALRDHDPEDRLSEISSRAGWALTRCSQACEDKVEHACTLLHDLITTPFLPTTCRLQPKHCVDICAFPSDDTVSSAVCALVRKKK